MILYKEIKVLYSEEKHLISKKSSVGRSEAGLTNVRLFAVLSKILYSSVGRVEVFHLLS